MKIRKKQQSFRITEIPVDQGPRRANALGLVPPQIPRPLAPEILEALCKPRKRRRAGEPDVMEYGKGKYLYLRMSRHDGSAEAFRFRTQAEADEAMRIGMEVDALARRGAASRD